LDVLNNYKSGTKTRKQRSPQAKVGKRDSRKKNTNKGKGLGKNIGRRGPTLGTKNGGSKYFNCWKKGQK